MFDPQDLVPEAEKLRWNPVKGCEVPQKAILRARGFAGFAGVGPAVDGGGAYWEQVAASIIRSYLHAAALEGLGVERLLDVVAPARSPRSDPDPFPQRRRLPGVGAKDLAASAGGGAHDIGTRSGRRSDGRSTASPTPRCWRPPGSTTTRSMPPSWNDYGTIYLMGSPGAQHSVAPIVAALIEDIVDTARRQAADSATRRLESALLLMLDECANIAPLGDLPKLVAELGGLGITTAVILQSVASARNVWGEAGERALRDLANITLVWGGQKDVAFLEEISRLAGEHDEQVETTTYGPSGPVEFVDGTPDAGAADRGHRQPATASRGGRVPTPPASDHPPASWREIEGSQPL